MSLDQNNNNTTGQSKTSVILSCMCHYTDQCCNPPYLLLSVTGLKIETEGAGWWPTSWRGVLGVTAAHPGWWISLYVKPLQWIIISCCVAVWRVQTSPPTSLFCLKCRADAASVLKPQKTHDGDKRPRRRDSVTLYRLWWRLKFHWVPADKSHKYDWLYFYLNSLIWPWGYRLVTAQLFKLEQKRFLIQLIQRTFFLV